MFAAIAILVLLCFCTGTVVIPLRFPSWATTRVRGLCQAMFSRVDEASFRHGLADPPAILWWTRFWGIGSATLFVAGALAHGRLVENDPTSIMTTVLLGAAAMTASAVLVFTIAAFGTYLPRSRGYDVLNRCGFRNLWFVDLTKPGKKFRDTLTARTLQSSRVCVVDVTGFSILGKGPGPAGGLLYDALVAAPDVPVYLLLFNPDARVVDPERKLTSVYQNLLSEMNLSPSSFTRRMRLTLEVIEDLNENRSPEARIQVRYYGEKPGFQTIVFDDTSILSPWHAQEEHTALPYFEVARDSADPSLYESHRRHFARLWGTPVTSANESTRQTREESVETPWKAAKKKPASVRIPTLVSPA